MSSRFSIYSASFVHAGGTLNLRQLSEQSQQAGARISTVRPGGALDPAAHILSQANPTARFTTRDLAAIGGAPISPSVGLLCTGGHVARYQKRVEGGAFATGTSHFTQATAKGFLHIESIDCAIDAEDGAVASLAYIPLSTDGASPYTEDEDADFTSVAAPTFGSQFYMGGAYLDGVLLPGLVNQRVIPGIGFRARLTDGGVFPRLAASSIQQRDPMFELTFLKADISVAEIGSFFLNAASDTISVYFQRGSVNNEGRIAAATASHQAYNLTASAWGADNLQVAGEDDATVTVRVMGDVAMTASYGVALP